MVLNSFLPLRGVAMPKFQIAFMEQNDIPESARVLSIAMLNNPMHMAIFQGSGEKERLEIDEGRA